MFHKAIVRLTATYLSIIMVISIFFSLHIYALATRELSRGYGQRNELIMNAPSDLPTSFRRQLLETTERLTQEARGKVFVALLITNSAVLVAGGYISYLLARRSLRPIEEAHAALERFTADASHELRTPIAAMKSEIEVALMQSKLSTKETKQLLNSNLEELDVLTKLSENLLKMARLGNGTLTLKKQSLYPIVQTAVDRTLQFAENKNILIINNVSKQMQATTNYSSLAEILIIILDNAIKYSPKKSSITISGSNHEKSPTIHIQDQGIGMAKIDLPHIFDRFYQADTSRSPQIKNGHGLGLSIAKQITTKINASIEVTSKPGKGSRFSIRLNS